MVEAARFRLTGRGSMPSEIMRELKIKKDRKYYPVLLLSAQNMTPLSGHADYDQFISMKRVVSVLHIGHSMPGITSTILPQTGQT